MSLICKECNAKMIQMTDDKNIFWCAACGMFYDNGRWYRPLNDYKQGYKAGANRMQFARKINIEKVIREIREHEIIKPDAFGFNLGLIVAIATIKDNIKDK